MQAKKVLVLLVACIVVASFMLADAAYSGVLDRKGQRRSNVMNPGYINATWKKEQREERDEPVLPLQMKKGAVNESYQIENVIAITDNEYNEGVRAFSDGQTVYALQDGNNELFLYNGSSTIQLTDSAFNEVLLGFHDGQAIWLGDNQTFYCYNGTEIIQLTDDNYHNASQARFDEGQLVWLAVANVTSGRGEEIFYYNGIETIQLTSNNVTDEQPHIHNGQVVWYGSLDGHDLEVFLYDDASSTTTQLTNDSYDDYHCDIYNGQVAWTSQDSTTLDSKEIYLYDGTNTIQLTSNGFQEDYPTINNGQVAWIGYNGLYGPYDLYFYDGTTTTMLDTDIHFPHSHKITDGLVTWSSSFGQFLSNGTDVIPLPEACKIDNGVAVWKAHDGNDYEVFSYDGTTVTQLTDNDYDEGSPSIDNGKVAWAGYDGNDWELFVYDGTTTSQLTNNESDDVSPILSNDQIVWKAHDGNDYEIMLGGLSYGEGDKKVSLLHVPPGNPDKAHVINISKNALDAHLKHGDTIE